MDNDFQYLSPFCENGPGAVYLLNLSEDVQTLSVSHVIFCNDIQHLIDGLYFTDDIIASTDRTSIDMNIGEVKVIKVEENDARKSSGCRLNGNVKFPFGFSERGQNVYFSDHIKHRTYKIDFFYQVTQDLAQEHKAGQNDEPKQKAGLYCPVRSGSYSHGLCTRRMHAILISME